MNVQFLNSVNCQRILYGAILSVSIIITSLAALSVLAWELKTILIAFILITITSFAFFKRELSLYLVILLSPLEEVAKGVAFTPHYPWAKVHDIIPLFSWISLASLTGVLMRKTARIEETDFATPGNAFVITFFMWAFMSVSWAPSLYHSFFQLFLLTSKIIMFYLVVVTLRRNEAAHRGVVKMLIFSTVLLAAISIWSLYFLEDSVTGSYKLTHSLTLDYIIMHSDFRAKALSHPNPATCFLNISIAFAICLLLQLKDRFKKALLFIFIVFLIFGVLEMKSKAGIGSLLALGFFSLVTYDVLRVKFIRNLLIFLAVIVALFVMQSLGEGRTPRIIGSQEMSISARMQIWGRGLHDFITKAPGWGLGIGGFRYYTKQLPHAHSIYFSPFFEFGIVGILSFGGLIIALIAKLHKYVRYQKTYAQMMLVASAGSLLVLLIHGLVDFSYIDCVVWLTLGMVTGTILLVEEEHRTSVLILNNGIPRIT